MKKFFLAAPAAALGLAVALPSATLLTKPLVAQLFGGGQIIHVPNNAALLGTPQSAARVMRDGFTAAGDLGSGDYTWNASACSLNSGAGDNGSQVQALGGGCWIADFAKTRPNPMVWGADPTGTVDSGAAIQRAINANVGCIYFPPGIYLWNTAVTATGWTCLKGSGWTENIPNANPPANGTWINTTNTSIVPLTFANPNTRGSIVQGLAFEQTQPAPATGWAPTVYQPVFYMNQTLGEVTFEDLYFAGVYQGISSNNSGRTTMRHIRGQTFSYLAFIDGGASDTIHIDDIHIWPFWSGHAAVIAWQQANGDVIKFGRVDGVDADHIFGLGYKSCLHFAGNTTNGPATGVHIGSLNCDASFYPLWDSDTTSAAHYGFGSEAQIATMQCAATVTGGNCIQIDGANMRLKIGSLMVVTTSQSVLNITSSSNSPGSTVRIGSIDASGGFNYPSGNTSGSPYTGTYPAFNLVSNTNPTATPPTTGGPHQVSLAAPIIPSNGGYTAGSLTSGITNLNTSVGAAQVADAGNQTWYWATVASAGSYQIPNWCHEFYANGSGTITSITYKLPDGPVDGQIVSVFAGGVAQSGVVWSSTASVFAMPTSLTVGQTVKAKFIQPQNAWVRIQ